MVFLFLVMVVFFGIILFWQTSAPKYKRVFFTNADDDDTITDKLLSIIYDKNYYKIQELKESNDRTYAFLSEEHPFIVNGYAMSLSVWKNNDVRIGWSGRGTLVLRTINNEQLAQKVFSFFENQKASQ